MELWFFFIYIKKECKLRSQGLIADL